MSHESLLVSTVSADMLDVCRKKERIRITALLYRHGTISVKYDSLLSPGQTQRATSSFAYASRMVPFPVCRDASFIAPPPTKEFGEGSACSW